MKATIYLLCTILTICIAGCSTWHYTRYVFDPKGNVIEEVSAGRTRFLTKDRAAYIRVVVGDKSIEMRDLLTDAKNITAITPMGIIETGD